ncbi:protein LNK1-like [Cynara cardunculus var. scolymus]|uniref:protein LNK1-like n=1 Tax=Cynara cardunculus var. scolymus TaxID=59895 RepID=UPI000D631440|nr:protein LNK1-like [Cynara cardunculus var. scolymus]
MKRNMLQKDLWSHTPHDVFSALYDGQTGKDMSSLAFDDTRISSYCFKSSNITSNSEVCKDDLTLNGSLSIADSNSYAYQLNHIPPTDDLNFFNSCADKESSDLLYNDWPDVGNFEEVGRMLRSCSSSFGLGVTGNNDEMDWFTQEDSTVGCEEVLKMDFKFPCSETSALINISQDHGTPESDDKRFGYKFENKDEIQLKDQGVKSKGVLQLTNGRGAHFKKDNRMINLQKKQPKYHHTEGKKEGQCLGHDGSSCYVCDLKNNNVPISSVDESYRVFATVGYQHQERNLELKSSGYMQNNTYLHPSYGHITNQTTACPVPTGMKSECNGLTSPSQKESSYVSNQVHSMETSGDPSLQETIVKVDDGRNLHQLQRYQTSFTGSPRQMGMMLQSSKCDLISAQKQVYMSATELKNRSDLEGFRHGASAEIGLLNVPESSSLSSGSDDISLEATILLQLQQVMEHLDLKTKSCIKDSLYRLARSAEQRHNRAGLSSSTADYADIGRPVVTAGTSKCTGFLDIESNTNPIDRSLAHLLFHRPSDSSTLPASSPLKPSPKMHGFITSPPAVNVKLDCHEEAANTCN